MSCSRPAGQGESDPMNKGQPHLYSPPLIVSDGQPQSGLGAPQSPPTPWVPPALLSAQAGGKKLKYFEHQTNIRLEVPQRNSHHNS